MFVQPQETDRTRRPARSAPAGFSTFGEVIGAAFDSEAIETDWHNTTGRRVRDRYNTIYSALETSMGADALRAEIESRGLRTSRLPGNRGLSQIWSENPRYGQALLDIAQGRIEDFYGAVPATRADLERGVLDELRAEWDDASATLQMGRAGAGLAEFLGRGGAALTDQTSLMLMPLGGGSGSIGRAVLREAALGAAAEAAVLPRMYQQADRLGIPDPDAVSQVAMGAVLGGALGGAGEALSRALAYTRMRRELTAIPDEMSVVEAQAAVEAAVEALEAGRPVPPIVREESPEVPFAPRDESDLDGPTPEAMAIPTADDIEAERRRIIAENPQLNVQRPLSQYLRDLGGIQWTRTNPATGERELSAIAQELSARGISQRQVLGLVRRDGLADLDNVVAAELADGGTPRLRTGDDGIYVDRDALIEALIDEVDGRRPAYRTAEAEAAAQSLRDLEDSFAAIRRDMDAVASAEAIPEMEFSGPFIPRRQAGEDPLARADMIEREVEAYADAMDVPPSNEVRWDAMAYLDETGGNVEDALTRAMMDAIERDFDARSQTPSTARAEALPPGAADADAGRADRAAAENAGIDQGDARIDGPSERTAAGDQLLAPGIRPVSQRERLEAQQNAPLRGGDAMANDGLFDLNARLQRDMFDDPNNAQMQARYDEREAEMRDAWDGLEDVEVEVEGQTVTARQLLNDLEADRAHLQAIETCGWTGRGGGDE